MTDAGVDVSQLSDDQLRTLYGQLPASPVPTEAVSSISDDDLKRLYVEQQARDPGFFGNLTNTAARWATAGLSDLAGAAGTAVGNFLRGGGTGQNYTNALATEHEQARDFAAEHPYANGIAALSGAATLGAPGMGWPSAIRGLAPGASLTPAISAITSPAAPTVGRRMLSGAGVGAGIGGASGYSNSPTGSGTDALAGAATGAILGAATPVAGELLSVPIDAFSRRFLGGADTQALDRIAGRIRQDAEAGGPGIADIQTALTGANGKPLSIADVAGENTQALAGKVTRMPGAGREQSTTFLADRNSGAGPRMTADVDTAFPGQNAFQTAQDLMQQRAAAAKPLWQKFYEAPPLNPDHIAPGGDLDQLMTRPAMVDASRRALRIAAEEGRDPASLGITFNPAGDPVFERVPSWQTLDYVKRGLDDVINGLPKNPVTGRLQPDEAGRAVLGTKSTFLDFLDQNNPAYAPARDAYAGPSAALSALQKGQDFRSMRPELIDYTMSNLSPSEREFFRVGAADALRQEIARTGDPRVVIGANAVNQRGADLLKQQLRPLFDSQSDFDRFVGDMSNESLMLANTNKFVGNSATGARLAEDTGAGHGGGGVLSNVATMGGAVLTGEPFVAASRVPALFSAMRNAGEVSADNPAVNAATARMLFSSNPQTNAQTLASLIARSRYPSLSQQVVAPTAEAGGSSPLNILRIGGALAHVLAHASPPGAPPVH